MRVVLGDLLGLLSASAAPDDARRRDLADVLLAAGEIVSNGSGDSRAPRDKFAEAFPEGVSGSGAREALTSPLPFAWEFPKAFDWVSDATVSMEEAEALRVRRVVVLGRAAFKGGLACRASAVGPSFWVVSRQSGELFRRRRPVSHKVRCFLAGGARPSSKGSSGVRRTEPRRDGRGRRAIARHWRGGEASGLCHAGNIRGMGGRFWWFCMDVDSREFQQDVGDSKVGPKGQRHNAAMRELLLGSNTRDLLDALAVMKKSKLYSLFPFHAASLLFTVL